MNDRDNELKKLVDEGVESLNVFKRQFLNEDFLNGPFNAHYEIILSGVSAENELKSRSISIKKSLISDLNGSKDFLLTDVNKKSGLETDDISWLEILYKAKGARDRLSSSNTANQTDVTESNLLDVTESNLLDDIEMASQALESIEGLLKEDEPIDKEIFDSYMKTLDKGLKSELALYYDVKKMELNERYKTSATLKERERRQDKDNIEAQLNHLKKIISVGYRSLSKLDKHFNGETVKPNGLKILKQALHAGVKLDPNLASMFEKSKTYQELKNLKNLKKEKNANGFFDNSLENKTFLNTSIENSNELPHIQLNTSNPSVTTNEDALDGAHEKDIEGINQSNIQNIFNEVLDRKGASILGAHDLKIIARCIDVDSELAEPIGIKEQFQKMLQDIFVNETIEQVTEEIQRINVYKNIGGCKNNSACELYLDEARKASEALLTSAMRQKMQIIVNGHFNTVGFTNPLASEISVQGFFNQAGKSPEPNNELAVAISVKELSNMITVLKSFKTNKLNKNVLALTDSMVTQFDDLIISYSSQIIPKEIFAEHFKKIVEWEGECGMQWVNEVPTIGLLPEGKPHGYVILVKDNKNELYYLNKYDLPNNVKKIECDISALNLGLVKDNNSNSISSLTSDQLNIITKCTSHQPLTPLLIFGQHLELDTLMSRLAIFIEKVCRYFNCPELAERFAPKIKQDFNAIRNYREKIIPDDGSSHSHSPSSSPSPSPSSRR